MGCDIHLFVERLHKGVWVPVNPEPAPQAVKDDYGIHHWGRYVDENPLEEIGQAMLDFEDRVPSSAQAWWFGRNYPAFAQLAGVRGDHGIMQDPEGVPDDASPAVWKTIMILVDDGNHDDEDEDEDTRNVSVMTAETAQKYGRTRVERRGRSWVQHPDFHTPSFYTLEGLNGGIYANKVEGLPVEHIVEELCKALASLATAYNLPDTDVRTVFWFDN